MAMGAIVSGPTFSTGPANPAASYGPAAIVASPVGLGLPGSPSMPPGASQPGGMPGSNAGAADDLAQAFIGGAADRADMNPGNPPSSRISPSVPNPSARASPTPLPPPPPMTIASSAGVHGRS